MKTKSSVLNVIVNEYGKIASDTYTSEKISNMCAETVVIGFHIRNTLHPIKFSIFCFYACILAPLLGGVPLAVMRLGHTSMQTPIGVIDFGICFYCILLPFIVTAGAVFYIIFLFVLECFYEMSFHKSFIFSRLNSNTCSGRNRLAGNR